MEGTTTSMTDMISSALETLMDVSTTVINFALENPVLAVLFVSGTIVPAGFAFFRSGKNAVS